MAVTQRVKESHPTNTKKRKPQGSKPILGSHTDRNVAERLVDHYSLPSENSEIDTQVAWMNDDRIQTVQRQSVARIIGHDFGNIQLQRMAGSVNRKKEEEAQPEIGEQDRKIKPEEEIGDDIAKSDISQPEKPLVQEKEPGVEPLNEPAPPGTAQEVKPTTKETGEETLETQPDKALEAQAKPGGLAETNKEATEAKVSEVPLETPAEQAEGKTTDESLEKESPAAGEGGRGALTATEPTAGEESPAIPPAVENASLPAAGGPGGPLQALADQVNAQREKIEGAVRSGQTQLVLDGFSLKAILSGILLARRLEVDSTFKTRSTELETLRKDQKNKIETQRVAQRQAIEQGYQAKLAGLVQVYNKRFLEMHKSGDLKASGVSHFANRRGAWLSAQTLTNVQRGLQIGENKARSYKDQKRGSELGAMARKVASRWSSNISKMGGEIYLAISKEGNEKATEIRDMASKVANKFANGVLETQKALRKIRDQALAKIDEAAKAAMARVDPVINQAQAALVALKGIIFTNLQRLKMGFQVSIDTAVAKGISALSIAGQTRINDIEQDYTNISGTMAMAESAGQSISPAAIGVVSNQYASAGSAYSGEITRGKTLLRGMLFGSLALVTSQLSTLVSRLEGTLAKLIGGISTGLEDMVQKSGMGKITENAQATMGSVVTKFDTQLGEATNKAGVELDKAVNTSQQSIDQKALQTQAVETQQLGELEKQIDAKVKDMQRSWYARVGLAALAVLAGVGVAAWKLIKGLGQAIAVIALVLVAILAVVGLVFGVLALLVGSATAALVALLVGVVLAAVAAIAAVGVMIYSLVKAAHSIAENFAIAYTDGTLTTFQRGTHAGEAVGDIAANVLPNIPKIGRGLNKGIGASFKWLGSKTGARVTVAASTVATKAKGLYTKSKDILMANKPFEKVASAASKARTFLKREVKLDEKGRPSLAPTPKPPPELAVTLPPEKAPTLRPGETPAVRGQPEGVPEAPELAPTLPPEKAPTLQPGESIPVRGPRGRGAEAPEAATQQPELPHRRTLRGMGPYGAISPPKLVRRFDSVEAALGEYIARTPTKKPYNIASPRSLREQWGVLNEAGRPPAGWIDSNGELWIDGEKVLGWWGGTPPPGGPLHPAPVPISNRPTVPYAESPILNRPGANVPPELVKTLPFQTLKGMGHPGPTLPPGPMPPSTATLPPGGGTQHGLGLGPTLPPGGMPPGTTALPLGGSTQRGLGSGPTLPPGTMAPGAPTAPYPRMTLGPEPPGGGVISSGTDPAWFSPGSHSATWYHASGCAHRSLSKDIPRTETSHRCGHYWWSDSVWVRSRSNLAAWQDDSRHRDPSAWSSEKFASRTGRNFTSPGRTGCSASHCIVGDFRHGRGVAFCRDLDRRYGPRTPVLGQPYQNARALE